MNFALIVLSFLTTAAFGFAGFIYYQSQKNQEKLLKESADRQEKILREAHAQQESLQKDLVGQMKELSEMAMAGSYQEWSRIKKGGQPIPNDVKSEPNMIEVTEENPIPLGQVTHVQVNDEPKRKIKIYR